MSTDINKVKFNNLNVDDPFFTSLKDDYEGFEDWFRRKLNEDAFVHKNDVGALDGFLYLKIENESIDMVDLNGQEITREMTLRLKVGTFKIVGHGTKLGERFVGRLINTAVRENVREIYVTIFDKHEGLIKLLEKDGFSLLGRSRKNTKNGREGYYFKVLANPS